MPKQQMQDIIPPEKRTIRNIPIARAKRASSSGGATPPPPPPPAPSESESMDSEPEETSTDPNSLHHLPPQPPLIPKAKRRWWLWGIGVVVIIIIVFLLLSLAFAGATLDVTPRQESVLIDAQFQAVRSPDAGTLGFEVMTVTMDQSKIVDATGEEFVDQKASGKIVIFNDFNDQNQRLIKNTRFETPEGLIYRIQESIVVPGQEEDDGGNIVPGSIEVTVYSDTSGEEYNIGLTDFTVPGFEGEPQFSKFYARSKTTMTGGFAGLQKTVSNNDEDIARAELQAELSVLIEEEANTQVPEGFVLYKDASFMTFSSLPNESTDSDDEVAVKEQVTFQGIIFNEQEFAREVALNTVASYEGGSVDLLNIEGLSVEIVDKDLIEPITVETIDFVVTGSDTVVWLFDEARLKEDLAGKSRGDTETVLSGYPSIEEAEITLRPFWKRNFPGDSEKIRVRQTIGG